MEQPITHPGLPVQNAARIMALEFAVRVLIKTHPALSEFAATWREQSSSWVDAAMDSQYEGKSLEFVGALNAQLQRLAMHFQHLP
jgi:hypothetical protein